MDTRKLWKALTEEQQKTLSEKTGVSVGHLYLIFYGHRPPSPELARRLEDACPSVGMEIPRQHWLPELFA